MFIRSLNIFIVLASAFLIACNGSSSSDSGLVIQGTLIEDGGAGHSAAVSLRHSVGQKIENVVVCALGECSITDGEGQWGFAAPESFVGGEVLFNLDGHGIATTSVVEIPAGAQDIFINFRHVAGGNVEAHHVTVDGETEHNEPHGH